MAPVNRSKLVKFKRSIALIIGVNDYQKAGAPLLTPIQDARKIKEVLIEKQGFLEEDIFLMENPTGQKILDKLAEFKTEDEPVDEKAEKKKIDLSQKSSFLFYFAGHGVAGNLDEGPKGYFLGTDAKINDGKLSENETLVPMEEVFDAIQAINAHHTLLILDCCFSGAFGRINRTRALKIGLRPMTHKRFERYKKKRAWQVLSSTGPTEKAADLLSERGEADAEDNGKGIALEGQHSPFAEALINVLAGNVHAEFKPAGKRLGDGVLTVNEMSIYLHHIVEKRTDEDENFKPQNPDLFPMAGHDGGQFIFFDPRHPINDKGWAKRKNDNPYKGLKQFDLPDNGFYFGRETDVRNLSYKLKLKKRPKKLQEEKENKVPPVLLITGPSGCGKSSLIKAGILPLYHEKEFEIFQLKPGDKPWELKRLEKNIEEGELTTYSWEPIPNKNPETKLFSLIDPTQKQILYIDQYEELFTECTNEEKQVFEKQLETLFTDIMRAEVQAKSPEEIQLRVILSMRSDFEWQMEISDFGKLFWGEKDVYYQLYRLVALGLDDLRSALVNPALMLAYEFEKDLEDRILEDLNYLPNSLPVLSFTMQKMVELVQEDLDREEEDRTFRHADYQSLGGVGGVLSAQMDHIYNKIVSEDQLDEKPGPTNVEEQEIWQRMIRQLFLRMIRLNDGEYSRRRVFRRKDADELDFSHNPEDQAMVARIIDRLVKEQVLSIGGDAETGQPYVELIHDSLINSWTRGKTWIQEFGKDNIVLQRQLWQAILDYLENEKEGKKKVSKSRAIIKDNQSHLWDNNPKLQQVFQSVIRLGDELSNPNAQSSIKKSPKYDYSALQESISLLWNDDTESRESKEKIKKFQTWLANERDLEIPLELISNESGSIQTRAIWEAILISSFSWLNAEEARFVMESWSKKIKWIQDLKKERDDARAFAWTAKASLKLDSNPTTAYNLSHAAYQLSQTAETTAGFDNIFGKKNTFYRQWLKDISDVQFVTFASDGKTIVGDTDKLKEKAKIKEVFERYKSRLFVFNPAMQSDRNIVLVNCKDTGPKLIDLESLAELKSYERKYLIYSLAFSNDGKFFLTGDEEGYTKLWNTESGKRVMTFNGRRKIGPRDQRINAVAFSADGEFILTGSNDCTARLWSRKKGFLSHITSSTKKEIHTFRGHKRPIRAVAISPDGKFILTGSEDETAKLWNLESGEEIQTFIGNESSVESVGFSPDGKFILTGSRDKGIKVWPVKGGPEIHTLKGHSSMVKEVAFSPDGDLIITGSPDDTVKLWDMKTGKEIHSFLKDDEFFFDLSFSPDGRFLIKQSRKEANIWDMEDGESIQNISEGVEKQKVILFSPDNQLLLTKTNDQNAKLWVKIKDKWIEDIEGQSIRESKPDAQIENGTSGKGKPKGKPAAKEKGQKNIKKKKLLIKPLREQPVGKIVLFSPDGETILTNDDENRAVLFDSKTGQEIRALEKQEFEIKDLIFSPDGKSILIMNEKNIQLYNLDNGEKIQTIAVEGDWFTFGAFSPDSESILTISSEGVQLWDIKSGQQTHFFPGKVEKFF